MANNKMPQFDLDQVKSVLTVEEFELFSLTLNKSHLRATKPTEKKCGEKLGDAYYIWRMTAFYLVGFPPHNCMPVCADWLIESPYLGEKNPEIKEKLRAEYKAHIKYLDAIINKVVDSQPLRSKKGILQWGRALGYF